MTEITFRKAEMEDKDLISSYFKKYTSRSCERTFSNTYLWSRRYPVTFAIVENTLVFKSEDEKHLSFAFPAGEDEDIKNALTVLKQYSEDRGYPFSLYMVSTENFEKLNQWYPDRFTIEYNRDSADYVYESEKLITLAGKKLHAKRNHINKFKSLYEGRWTYEVMTKDNIEDCFQMAVKWRKESECEENDDKCAEVCVTLSALAHFEELELKGGLIRIDEEVVAFTIGEPICEDTFVVHIEKAFADIQGAYPMINQQFVEHECSEYIYINREEDTGAEGLRKAKLSYRPVFLVEKGKVTEKE